MTDTPKRRSNLRFEAINLFFDRGAAEAKLSLIAVAVWPPMWRHARPDGRVSVSGERLERSTGLSESSIKRAIAELREKRMLKLVTRGGIGRGASVYLMSPIPMPIKSRPTAETTREGAGE